MFLRNLVISAALVQRAAWSGERKCSRDPQTACHAVFSPSGEPESDHPHCLGQTTSQQFASIIDRQVQFEAVKPAHPCFATLASVAKTRC